MDTYTKHDPTDSTRAWLLRFGAVAGVFFGLSLGVPGIIEAFTGETTGTSFIVALGVAAFGLPALLAFHLHQADAAGRFGAVAFAVNAIGLGLFAAGSFAFNLVLFFVDDSIADAVLDGPTMWALLGGGLIFVVGTVLFGASMVRTGMMPRAAAVGYSVGLVMIALLGSLDDSLVSSLAHVIAAASLMTLSARVWRGTAGSSEHTTRARVAVTAPVS
jgi:hypothetical protein